MICEKNCIWNLTWHVSMLASLMDLGCAKYAFCCGTFFLCMLPIPSSPSKIFQHEMCSYSPTSFARYPRNSKVADYTVHSSNPHPTAPIILNGTETSRHCTETVCVRLSSQPINLRSANFPTSRQSSRAGQESHAPCRRRGGGRGNLRGRAWLGPCGVQNFNNEGRGRKQARLVLVFLVGRRVLSCCWRGPPHHRLP